jgi:hypothetical protein
MPCRFTNEALFRLPARAGERAHVYGQRSTDSTHSHSVRNPTYLAGQTQAVGAHGNGGAGRAGHLSALLDASIPSKIGASKVKVQEEHAREGWRGGGRGRSALEQARLEHGKEAGDVRLVLLKRPHCLHIAADNVQGGVCGVRTRKGALHAAWVGTGLERAHVEDLGCPILRSTASTRLTVLACLSSPASARTVGMGTAPACSMRRPYGPAQSRCRCGSGEPSPDAGVGRGGPSPGAAVAAASAVPV